MAQPTLRRWTVGLPQTTSTMFVDGIQVATGEVTRTQCCAIGMESWRPWRSARTWSRVYPLPQTEDARPLPADHRRFAEPGRPAAGALRSVVDIEIEILLLQPLVSPVFANGGDGVIDSVVELAVILSHPDRRPRAEDLRILQRRAGKCEPRAFGRFQEAELSLDAVLQRRVQSSKLQVRVHQILVLVGNDLDVLRLPVCLGIGFPARVKVLVASVMQPKAV
jgi:hypothetical protein